MSSNEKAVAEKLLQSNAIKLNPAQPFTWASGWKSPIYCDNRRVLSFPFIRDFIKSEMCNVIFQDFPEAELLAAAKRLAQCRINQAYEAEFDVIKQQYPDAERESWPIQLSEAAALAEDPQAPAPFLDALLVARGFGETRTELAAKVQAKNVAYSTLSVGLTGKRHRLERAVLESTSVKQLQAIAW